MSDKKYDTTVTDEIVELFLQSTGAGEFHTLTLQQKQSAAMAYQQALAQLDPQERSLATDFLRQFLSENARAFLNPNASLEVMKTQLKSSAAAAGVRAIAGTALSAAQIAKGRKVLNNTDMPKFPEFDKGTFTDKRIGDLERLVATGDPEMQAGIDKGAADLVRSREARAASSGQVGDYLALSQQGDIDAATMKRAGLGELANMRLARENALNNLAQLKFAENQSAYGAARDKFTQALMPEYQRKVRAGESLVNAGVTNLFGSLNSAMQAVPMIKTAQAYGALAQPTQAGRPTYANPNYTGPQPQADMPFPNLDDGYTPWAPDPNQSQRSYGAGILDE